MKFSVWVLTFVCLLFTTIFVFAQDNPQDQANVVEYIVTADSGNVRSEPGTNSQIVGTVSNGESLLIYDEVPETSGWLRIYRFGGADIDAYIADFLVERAPMRFYPASQEPIATISGRGRDISDVVEIPAGAYRIDAVVSDNAFILQTIVVEGECNDTTVFNELDFNVNRLEISGLFVSSGCSFIFESDNTDGNWEIAIRDILDLSVLNDALELEDGSTISGKGRALTMATSIGEGIWEISATVQDRAFILWARPIGDCEEEAVFNELDFDANTLEMSTVYRVGDGGCIVFWETSNVEGEWELQFENIR